MKNGKILISFLIVLTVMLLIHASEVQPKTIEGIWLGTLKVQGIEIRIVFNIVLTDQGIYEGTMDSPDQGATGLRLDVVQFQENTLIIEFKQANIRYEANFIEEGEKLDGRFKQGGIDLPLEMTRIEEVPKITRPQDPKKPYSYREEEVSYINSEANITLAGTLTSPDHEGTFPAVVLITGSGAQDRNEEVMGHRPFLVLADHLTKNGIAVLRVDDRGVGGSTGNIDDSTSIDFAQDVIAGVEFLKTRKDINSKKIGLIGHSEGGLIAPIAASMTQDVSFIVMMAGTGLTGEEIIYLQSRLIAQASGVKSEEIEQNLSDQRKIFTVVKGSEPVDVINEKLKKMFFEDFEAMSEDERQVMGDPEASFYSQVKQVTSRWFRFFLTCDPITYLRKVKCPVLAINGEKDLQVPPKENLAAIAQALKDGGNTHVTIKELPGLNHLFQKATTGVPSEYAKINETINPEVLTLISSWILEIIDMN
ncbi:MAG: alpha/beta fold hydrolase [Candidatus Aminicenantes bacterium]|nr:alpha/beta fold hydrolase [Candidatus Aminicenantes bacterium]